MLVENTTRESDLMKPPGRTHSSIERVSNHEVSHQLSLQYHVTDRKDEKDYFAEREVLNFDKSHHPSNEMKDDDHLHLTLHSEQTEKSATNSNIPFPFIRRPVSSCSSASSSTFSSTYDSISSSSSITKSFTFPSH